MHSNSSHFRYRLHFKKETQEEIDQRKYTAKTKILVPVDEVLIIFPRYYFSDPALEYA